MGRPSGLKANLPQPITDMYAFFDKFGKKVLAVAAALLILAFLLPPTFTGQGIGGPDSLKVGTLNGRPVYAIDLQNASARLQNLNVLLYPITDPMTGQARQLAIPELIFDTIRPGLAAELQQNQLQWYLLLQEARAGGVGVSEDQINELLSDPTVYRVPNGQPVSLSKGINPNIIAQLREDLRDALAVRLYIERSIGMAVKVSDPLLNDHLARTQQQVQLRLSVIDPAQYAGEAKDVSEEALRLQFDAFAATVPGTVDRERNPFGFGYRIPDRVRIQYVAVPRAEVERAVIASKSPAIWEEDAIMYYKRNPERFQTQPQTSPGEAATQPASQPTTRPFAEVREEVLSTMRDPLIEQKQQAVVNGILRRLQADYQKATAPAKDKPAPTTQEIIAAKPSYGVEYGSYDYLLKLAEDIQREFGVKITVANQANLLSADEINAIDGLSLTFVDEPGAMMRSFRGAGEYLIESTRALQPSSAEPKPGMLDLLQPSRVIRALDGTAYIARVLEAEPSHPPRTLEEVRAQVEKDVRTKLAFGKAVEAAEKIVAAAREQGGLDKAPGAGVVLATKHFNATATDIGIEGTEEWEEDLVPEAFNLLRDLKSVDQLPVYAVLKLQRANKVVAAQLVDVKTERNTAVDAFLRLGAQRELERSLLQDLSADEWFSVEAVQRRVGFKPEEPANGPAPREPAPRPMNPFAP